MNKDKQLKGIEQYHNIIEQLYKLSIIMTMEKDTKFNTLGARVIYNLVSWFVLGYGIQEGNGFFVASILYTSSLLLDYLKTTSYQKNRQYIKKIQCFICIFFCIGSGFGLIGILEIATISDVLVIKVSNDFIVLKSFYVMMEYIWLSMFLLVGCTIIDWLIAKPAIEDSIDSIIKEKK